MMLPLGIVSPGDDVAVLARIRDGDRSDLHRARRRAGFRARRRRRRADGGVARGPRGARGRRSASTTRACIVRRKKRSRLAFEQFYRDEWGQLTTRAAALGGYHLARALVARRLRAVRGAGRRAASAGLARVAGAAARPRSGRARRGAPPARARSAATPVPAVDRRDAVAGGARGRARLGVTVFGDLPFMVPAASPDVWARPDEFMFDVSLGVPPDAFSATGQDWGAADVPLGSPSRQTGYAWMRQRARRMAALYDGYRVDHLVGLFRTFGRPRWRRAVLQSGDGARADRARRGDPAHSARGRRRRSSPKISASSRTSSARRSRRLDVPGCKVLRWERDWHAPGHPFRRSCRISPRVGGDDRHPRHRAACRLVDPREDDERRAAVDVPTLREAGCTDPAAPWSEGLRDAWLTAAYESGSVELFLPMQDVFGWADRINIPATVGSHNWTWRLPWRVDRFAVEPLARQRAEFCANAARRGHRSEV